METPSDVFKFFIVQFKMEHMLLTRFLTSFDSSGIKDYHFFGEKTQSNFTVGTEIASDEFVIPNRIFSRFRSLSLVSNRGHGVRVLCNDRVEVCLVIVEDLIRTIM